MRVSINATYWVNGSGVAGVVVARCGGPDGRVTNIKREALKNNSQSSLTSSGKKEAVSWELRLGQLIEEFQR